MKTASFGDRAMLVSEIDPKDFNRLSSWLKIVLNSEGYLIRRGLDSILIENPLPTVKIKDALTSALARFNDNGAEENTAEVSEIIEIPCLYDGEDLNALSIKLEVNVGELIALHKNTLWRVALVGFAPGFPYLVPANPDDANLFSKATRLDIPRTAVPAGSIAVAAGTSAIYPNRMPGGWNLIGRTETVLFDASSLTPSKLNVNDLVKFVEKK